MRAVATPSPASHCPIRISVLAVFALCAAACQVALMAQYDEQTDQQVSALQRDVEMHLTRMEKLAVGFDGTAQHPKCDFATQQEFYSNAEATTQALITRNAVRPKNTQTQQQLGLLLENLKSLEELHRGSPPDPTHCLSVGNIQIAHETMAQMFRAILNLELAKRRGESAKEQ
jgi:hypothetical protein